MKKGQNVFLVGPMGAGKSSIGLQVAKKLQMDFYDSDAVIEEKAGVDISWIFDVEGEAGLDKREIAVINELTQLSNMVLATGGGTINAPENRNALASRGTVVYLQASLEQQIDRTSKSNLRRPLLRTENPRDVIVELNKVRDPLYQEIADVTFATDGNSVNHIANQIIEFLREY